MKTKILLFPLAATVIAVSACSSGGETIIPIDPIETTESKPVPSREPVMPEDETYESNFLDEQLQDIFLDFNESDATLTPYSAGTVLTISSPPELSPNIAVDEAPSYNSGTLLSLGSDNGDFILVSELDIENDYDASLWTGEYVADVQAEYSSARTVSLPLAETTGVFYIDGDETGNIVVKDDETADYYIISFSGDDSVVLSSLNTLAWL